MLTFFDFKKSKRSCEIALRIIHTMLFDDSFKLSQAVQEEFPTYTVEMFLQMDLGKHFYNYEHKLTETKNNKTNYALEIIDFIL